MMFSMSSMILNNFDSLQLHDVKYRKAEATGDVVSAECKNSLKPIDTEERLKQQAIVDRLTIRKTTIFRILNDWFGIN